MSDVPPMDDDSLDRELADLAKDSAAGVKDRKPTGAKKPSTRATPIQKKVQSSLAGVELMTRVLLKDDVCADAIAEGSEQLARSLDDLAKQNPKVKKALETAMTGGAWGEVVASALAIVFPILVHHGIIGGGGGWGGGEDEPSGFEPPSESDGQERGRDAIGNGITIADTVPSVG